MITFIVSIILLVLGYFIYGRYVTKVFGADNSIQTPVHTKADNVDYVPMSSWRIFLIQFLNIAGLGPIFGAIMGIMYGPSAFLWIVFGTIFGGAVHDYMSGMLSLRYGGISLPEIVGIQLGNKVKMVLRIFTLLLMVLVGAVFVYNPADLLAMLTSGNLDRNFWIVVIMVYYMLATMLPIDKVIGKIYPLFGIALLFMAVGVMVAMFSHSAQMPEIWHQFYNHKPDPEANPIFPMMFVSIACGAISGFHATQSPMMARCLKQEKHAHAIFYGAMVTEGIVALIWAAAAITFTGGYGQLQEFLGTGSPAILVNELSKTWLGTFGGILAILGVIAAPISSGDTAFRSARLITADFMNYSQKKILNRFIVSIPLFALGVIIMLLPYEVLWRYFAWSNQTLSVFTLWAITVYLARNKRNYFVTLIPALFMTVVVVSYIMFAPEGIGIITESLFGYTMGYELSVGIGVAAALGLLVLFYKWLKGIDYDPERPLKNITRPA